MQANKNENTNKTQTNIMRIILQMIIDQNKEENMYTCSLIV